MPELPEVEVVIRRLRPEAVGVRITGIDVFRPRVIYPQKPDDLAKLKGKQIEAIDRRGKNIIIRLTGGLACRIHLGMNGNLLIIPDARLHTPATRVLVKLRGGRGLAFEDYGAMAIFQLHSGEELEAKLGKLGVEPLTRAFTKTFLIEAAKRSMRPIKPFLMNQGIIAGIGNIYAAESLFEAKIHPEKPANRVTRQKLEALHAAIPKVLRRAIRDALKTYSRPGRHQGMHFHVYGRKGDPCHVCGKPIRNMQQDGRTTYFCAHCQRK